jgi:3-isopropylmalate/(R)-2-methylmalate dehydratase large subunit
MQGQRTLYDKIWDSHVVEDKGDGFALLYVDCLVLDDHTSPQAFDALRQAGRSVRRPEATFAVVDHNAPLPAGIGQAADAQGLLQIRTLESNAKAFGIACWSIGDSRQGISHVVAPEQGLVQPGMVVVCGDSHAVTYGALGTLGVGVGTTELGHVLATQTLVCRRAATMRLTIEGRLAGGVTSKDLVLAIVGRLGSAGAAGFALEFAGSAVQVLSVEERMTLCNMSVELGAVAALVAPDEKVFDYLHGRPFAPKAPLQHRAESFWRTLASDADARFDREIAFDARTVAPQVTWGTSPEHVIAVSERIPDPADAADRVQREAMMRALDYMGLTPGEPVTGTPIDKVFIGSCTNGRIEDLRAAAAIARGRTIARHVHALVVPGSGLVKAQAEREGLAAVFRDAGFDWRDPGCSMCLGMNGEVLGPGERCASTTSRNFEGRQGPGGRTHLVSPPMAAAAAVAGRIVDVRTFSS